ncbi:MAG TPA: DsbA family protein [Caulobacteraceae bacterium]|nr:DsbA family protein [Caulobacteraceae bacterium]
MIDYFHQVDDPYSHLIVQLLPALTARYGVPVRPWLVPPPDDAAAPERERLAAYARRDAARIAPAYGLAFPEGAAAPDAEAVTLAQRILAGALGSDRFAERAIEVGRALWSGQPRVLEGLAPGVATADSTARTLADGEAERRRLGHYLGAMLHHDGQWFWGVDRLWHLEEKLAAAGLDTTPRAPSLARYRGMTLGPPPKSDRRPTIELWFSFRSPYSWIAFPRVRQLAAQYGARLELRYILPMVMRGLPVPPVKSLYIVIDTKRQADKAGLPFGPISDPVGPGAERALAVLHHAVPLGLGEAFAESALRAAWAEGVALASDEGLLGVARRAGLTDAQVDAALGDDSWRQAAEANRQALFDAGLWGAPTYRVDGGEAHWGQDRLWVLEEDLIAALARR